MALSKLHYQACQTLALLLHELATNAAKHGALSVADGTIEIRWLETSDGLLEIDWKEAMSAPPAPKEPGRVGFGSKLLLRVVEDQLGGTIKRELEPDGLRCSLRIPFRSDLQKTAETKTSQTISDRKKVLIVEDEPLIALDLEAMVEDLSFGVFASASTVEAALKCLEKGLPDFAILDANLAGSSSRPVAEALVSQGVPIIFATGYADPANLPETLAAAPRLSKPVMASDLSRAINDIGY